MAVQCTFPPKNNRGSFRFSSMDHDTLVIYLLYVKEEVSDMLCENGHRIAAKRYGWQSPVYATSLVPNTLFPFSTIPVYLSLRDWMTSRLNWRRRIAIRRNTDRCVICSYSILAFDFIVLLAQYLTVIYFLSSKVFPIRRFCRQTPWLCKEGNAG